MSEKLNWETCGTYCVKTFNQLLITQAVVGVKPRVKVLQGGRLTSKTETLLYHLVVENNIVIYCVFRDFTWQKYQFCNVFFCINRSL